MSSGSSMKKSQPGAKIPGALSAIQKIDLLEKAYNDLIPQVNNYFAKTDEQLENISLLLEAATEILGADEMLNKARAIKHNRLEAQVDRNFTALQNTVEQGLLVVGEKVKTSTDLFVISELTPDGVAKTPSKMFLSFGEMREKFPEMFNEDGGGVRECFSDIKVGDTIKTLEDGSTVVVLHIYHQKSTLDKLFPKPPVVEPENMLKFPPNSKFEEVLEHKAVEAKHIAKNDGFNFLKKGDVLVPDANPQVETTEG